MRNLLARAHIWHFNCERLGRDRGQATTEYALVMLGAAVIALLVVGWATSGGGAGKIGNLFDRVLDAVTGKL